MTKVGVIGMTMTDQRFVNRLPGVEINPGLFTKDSLIGELQEVHVNTLTVGEYKRFGVKSVPMRVVLRCSGVQVLTFRPEQPVCY